MIQIGEHRVFTENVNIAREGMEFIVRNILVHAESGDKYIGCEFYLPIRHGHDLSVGSSSLYSGYNGPCPENHGSYFSIYDIEDYTTITKALEPDWEI
ncbi:MAG: hypothetical protein ACXACW_11300 [Candidatus Hodarchaeales archaeon]|jgi:hypothetical protein